MYISYISNQPTRDKLNQPTQQSCTYKMVLMVNGVLISAICHYKSTVLTTSNHGALQARNKGR